MQWYQALSQADTLSDSSWTHCRFVRVLIIQNPPPLQKIQSLYSCYNFVYHSTDETRIHTLQLQLSYTPLIRQSFLPDVRCRQNAMWIIPEVQLWNHTLVPRKHYYIYNHPANKHTPVTRHMIETKAIIASLANSCIEKLKTS
jgi:hypothetical protein